MRVFAAIFPPDEVADDLARFVEPVRRGYPELGWTPAPLWHLTLAFFGNITHQDQVLLNDAVAKLVARQRPMRVRVVGGGAFPEPGQAATLWAGVESQDNALHELARELVGSVLHFGWMLDRRSFQAHLTLARARPARDLSSAVAMLSGYRGEPWLVPAVAVVWSRPDDHGEPFYELLGEHPFASG